MNVLVEQLTSWTEAYQDALVTVSKNIKNNQPSKEWKFSVLYPEHSPIRSCLYRVKFIGLRSWVAVHFVRHHVGVQPFVSTQRTDRTKLETSRDDLPQGALVNVNMVLNAQAWISISRKRLCMCSSTETRTAWTQAVEELRKIDPVLASVCVRECVYRGFCPEKATCGFTNSLIFTNTVLRYRAEVENGRKEECSKNCPTTNDSQEQGTPSDQTPDKTRKVICPKKQKIGPFGRSKNRNQIVKMSVGKEVRDSQYTETPANN